MKNSMHFIFTCMLGTKFKLSSVKSKYFQPHPGLVFTKGLSQILGLNSIHLYRTFKPKTFVNTGPGANFTNRHTEISRVSAHGP